VAPDEDLTGIADALIAAIAEANARLTMGDSGSDAAELIRHARELHRLLLDAMASSRSEAGPRLRGLAVTLGNRMDRLEAAWRGEPRSD
jgi:hypothetical protein